MNGAEDFLRTIQEMAERARTSPHRCIAGCGERVLHDGQTCGECYRRELYEQQRQQRRGETWRSVPSRYQWVRHGAPELDDRVKDSRALAKMRKLITQPESIERIERAVFTGPAGIGKTVSATLLYRSICWHRDVVGLFTDAFTLATARAHSQLGHEAPAVKAALRAPVLLLDDLGAEPATVHTAIGEVIHARHAAQLTTVVTTGFSIDQLATRFGDGVARRVFEGATVIEMGGSR